MRLSTQADYAVRAVCELARREAGSVLHTDEIAAAQRIPKARLSKVVQDLARADVVRTLRGRQGGVVLARPAQEITVRDVYEAVEGPILMCRCRIRAETCEPPCRTHAFWRGVEMLLTSELETVTFADLAGGRLPAAAVVSALTLRGGEGNDRVEGAGTEGARRHSSCVAGRRR